MAEAPDGASRGDAKRSLVTLSVMLATIIQAVDTTIANVALPHMQGSVGATQDQISWVLTSYVVASAIFMPLSGFVAARLGRKRVLLGSVAGFTIASMLCGAAQNLDQIVLFRLLQGICGAGLVPLSQAVLLDVYPRERHASAMALWGVGVMVGPILGPTLGGWLTEHYSWRAVFYINLPLGALAWFGLAAFVRETTPDRTRPFDLAGFAMLSVCLGALQLMLDRGHSLGWFDSPEVVLECMVSAFALYLFVAHMFTHERPFIEPALFADRNFAFGMVFAFMVGLLLLATMALLPPFLQNLQGYPVLEVGKLMAPRGVGTMIAMMAVGRLATRMDPRLCMLFGLSVASFALWEMTQFTTEVSEFAIVHTSFLQGFGLGCVFVPLSTMTFATLAPRLRNEGTTLYSLIRNIGSSIGISIVITQLARQTQVNHALLSEHINPSNLALRLAGQSGAWDWSTPQGLALIEAQVSRQAAALAYLQDFRLMMWITLAAIPMLLLLRPPPRR